MQGTLIYGKRPGKIHMESISHMAVVKILISTKQKYNIQPSCLNKHVCIDTIKSIQKQVKCVKNTK